MTSADNEACLTVDAITDMDCDRIEQLKGIMKFMQPKDQGRFIPAARVAAMFLEGATPVALGVAAEGDVAAGVFSVFPAGEILVIAADASRLIFGVAEACDIEHHLESADFRFKDAEVSDENRVEICGQVLKSVVEEHGFAFTKAGTLKEDRDTPLVDLAVWRAHQGKFIPLLRAALEKGFAPAIVVLVAERGDGVVTLPVVYSRLAPKGLLD
jgi:hypothetical protein